MIKPPRATKPKIDFFSVYHEKKPPKTAPKLVFMVIHEKQMFFAILQNRMVDDAQKRASITMHPTENQKKALDCSRVFILR